MLREVVNKIIENPFTAGLFVMGFDVLLGTFLVLFGALSGGQRLSKTREAVVHPTRKRPAATVLGPSTTILLVGPRRSRWVATFWYVLAVLGGVCGIVFLYIVWWCWNIMFGGGWIIK